MRTPRKARLWGTALMLAASIHLAHSEDKAGKAPKPDACDTNVKKMYENLKRARLEKDLQTPGGVPPAQYLIETQVINPDNAPTCLVVAYRARSAKDFAPLTVPLGNAIASLSGSQQQGSSLPSSGSTNPVSKPSGLTGLTEEFGGVNVTNSTTSFTAQWAPGTMLTNLALTGAKPLCLAKNIPANCISPGLISGLTPLTLKITGNTSSTNPSVTGASATSSSGSTQQVNVASKGASGPSFSGLTVQYAFASKNAAIAKAQTSPGQSQPDSSLTAPLSKMLRDANTTGNDLAKCGPYETWKADTTPKLVVKLDSIPDDNPSQKLEELKLAMENAYSELLTNMLASTSEGCKTAISDYRTLLQDTMTVVAEDISSAAKSKLAAPEVALEYDLNTPQSKPSYSSFKVTGNWQFSKKSVKTPNDPAKTQKQATNQPVAGSSTVSMNQVAANAIQNAAKKTQPWSFTMTGTADIYNTEPPSTIPSASHLRDIQGGAELAYLFANSSKSGTLQSLIGNVRLSGAYSYQDQTSPAILTGAALSDFTGLPASTTTAYAKRGVIHLGQVKLGFGTGSTFSYPLSFTYSNRSELITHPLWGIQFGVSYNLSSKLSSPTAQ